MALGPDGSPSFEGGQRSPGRGWSAAIEQVGEEAVQAQGIWPVFTLPGMLFPLLTLVGMSVSWDQVTCTRQGLLVRRSAQMHLLTESMECGVRTRIGVCRVHEILHKQYQACWMLNVRPLGK